MKIAKIGDNLSKKNIRSKVMEKSNKNSQDGRYRKVRKDTFKRSYPALSYNKSGLIKRSKIYRNTLF